MSADDIVHLTEGFFVGAFGAEGMDVSSCIKDADQVFTDAHSAITDFEKKDITSIAKGLGEVADMLKGMQSAISDCKDIPADATRIVDMVKAFKSPTSFAWHVGKDLLLNGHDIYNDIDDGIKSFNSKNWNKFGQDIGHASAKLLLGEKEHLKVDVQMMVQIVEGFLKGAVQAEGLTDIEKCIQDVEGVVSDAETAIADFEKKDLSDIVAGFKALADLVGKVKSGMSDCGHLSDDLHKLETIVAVYTNLPAFAWHVGYDLLVNGVDIYHDIDSAISNFKSSNWEQFGENIGDASAKVFLGA
jgi:hypothetical protein